MFGGCVDYIYLHHGGKRLRRTYSKAPATLSGASANRKRLAVLEKRRGPLSHRHLSRRVWGAMGWREGLCVVSLRAQKSHDAGGQIDYQHCARRVPGCLGTWASLGWCDFHCLLQGAQPGRWPHEPAWRQGRRGCRRTDVSRWPRRNKASVGDGGCTVLVLGTWRSSKSKYEPRLYGLCVECAGCT